MPNAILYVFVDGTTQLRMAGERRELVAGDVLLSPADHTHSLRNDGPDPAEFFTTHFTAHVYGALDVIALCGFPTLLRPEPRRFAALAAVAESIVAQLDDPSPGCMLAANARCAEAVSRLWRETVEKNEGIDPAALGRSREVLRLAPVFRTMHTRYPDPLTLDDLAEVVHLAPTYFSALFKRATGMSPTRYLTDYRLRQVRRLLVTTDLSIAEIALATGFRDPFYLSRLVKRAEGRSPREYRRTQKSPGSP